MAWPTYLAPFLLHWAGAAASSAAAWSPNCQSCAGSIQVVPLVKAVKGEPESVCQLRLPHSNSNASVGLNPQHYNPLEVMDEKQPGGPAWAEMQASEPRRDSRPRRRLGLEIAAILIGLVFLSSLPNIRLFSIGTRGGHNGTNDTSDDPMNPWESVRLCQTSLIPSENTS